ncbi:FAD-binding domain-containing protein [Spiroplasma endosymbiont of Ammophila pubescens]|uniref:FAD-binding domain-containing protein n=1 Tax=Spiroplasma endosymbiont of Ammophila pubescens TaxID=3066315 RepID=UPI0032B2750B
MRQLSKEYNFIYREFDDYVLIEPWTIKTTQNGYYTVFTPFWNKLKEHFNVNKIVLYKVKSFSPQQLKNLEILQDITNVKSSDFNLPLVSEKVKTTIFQLDQNYHQTRDFVDLETSTAKISTALKFGIISIRQCYLWSIEKFGVFDNAFARQLAWQVTYNAQLHQQWSFSENWNKKITIDWTNNLEWLQKWQNGETGYDFIDAGMKELKETGLLHNRARMVCASFLVKNLKIDWRKGEQYFTQQLIDYDPIIY